MNSGDAFPSPLLALDIGGTSIRAALVQGSQVLERQESATPKPATPDAVIAAALELALPLSSHARAVGVACAGAVARGRVTATAAHTFPGWTDIPLADELARKLGLPCAALNDARAAAWGEYVAGAGQGSTEFMFVTVSTGVGAGLILGGQLHLAANGLDAEIGFVSVPAQWGPGVNIPPLGHLGPLEFETSGTALGARAQVLGFSSARALCDAAEAGDPRAEAEYQRSAALLAWKLADVAALLGITRVALGGSVGLRSGYLDRVRASLSHFPERYQPEVVHARQGADAGLLGAALWAGQTGLQL
ncbi:ROK family protein [Deinococcus deserti]|uniref:Putative N-acetylmannosamine kinase, putative sugar kinase n=1 Tax=Deinococcus deserti (strain DSM 17065 / CIP 109153 / LMG 22923 / VCD115) TaxID=546414 RepID=C1CVT9_DEIDV|nr:ROK family protein [Deinococcus deserti]ACO46306.1 putative N-acetylmannosamine kinase, putative sugar kinase [Deinococcus deserti VCD115]